MKKSQKTILIMCFSFLFGMSLLFMSFSESVWAQESEGEVAHHKIEAMSESSSKSSSSGDEEIEGTGVHADLATFQKNWELTAAQKEYTITECEKVVSALEKINPNICDLEKYFALALWANQRVEYDWDFWNGGYDFDYYSHQWDAYGAMDEDETSVCVGIAIFYSNLCHAADLPCRFVRLNPDYLDHTINYIPDINGHGYYVDVTESVFLMSGESRHSYKPEVDKAFAYIPEDGPGSCTDTAFDYQDEPDGDIESSNIKEFYSKDNNYEEWFGGYEDEPTYEQWFREYANHQTYEKWYSEYVEHQNREKIYLNEYEEKGSGTPGVHHASYHAYRSNFVDPTADPDSVWFLDDFYADPADIEDKILNKEFDAQLLDVSGLEKNYDCGFEELQSIIAEKIKVNYFPTSDEDNNIVAAHDELVNGKDYEVTCKASAEQTNTAEVTIKGIGDYEGTYTTRVKWKAAEVAKEPVGKKGLVYNKEQQPLAVAGKAKNGEMRYGLGTQTEPPEEFTADIPTAKNAGKYYVWYMVEGNGEYASTEPQRLERAVSIEPMKLKLILDDMTIKVGETGVISPKIDEEHLDALIPVTYAFESWYEDVASVTEDGVVTGLKKGSAPILVTVNSKYSSKNYSFSNSNFVIVHVVEGPVPDPTPDVVPDTVDIGQTKVALSKTAFTYNGKVQKPSVKTIKGLNLKAGTDYTATWAKGSKNAGTYTVTIKGIGKYTGTTDATYTINKANNPITVKAKTKKVKIKYKKLKKKAKSIKRANAFAVSKAQGKLSYKLVSAKKGKKSFRKKFSVNAKTGKVTVKKRLKKGTYKVKVKVKAAGNANYKASAWKTVMFKVKVK